MFSFLRRKSAAEKSVTVVHPDVRAPLVPQPQFSTAQPAAMLECTSKMLFVSGLPPEAKLLDEPIPDEPRRGAFLVEAGNGQPRLAFANVEHPGGDMRFEVWELGGPGEPTFARQRTFQLSPDQPSWALYALGDMVCLPANRYLLSVSYWSSRGAKRALYIYNHTTDAYKKLTDVQWFADNLEQDFEAQAVGPDAVMVHYFTDTIRLAADVYYNTPSHLRLFTPQYPEGLEVVQLGVADGSVRRFSVIDKTLWIDALDYRIKHQPKQLYFSLDLQHVLPR